MSTEATDEQKVITLEKLIAVKGPFFLTRCEHCGKVETSESVKHEGEPDDPMLCSLCNEETACDEVRDYEQQAFLYDHAVATSARLTELEGIAARIAQLKPIQSEWLEEEKEVHHRAAFQSGEEVPFTFLLTLTSDARAALGADA